MLHDISYYMEVISIEVFCNCSLHQNSLAAPLTPMFHCHGNHISKVCVTQSSVSAGRSTPIYTRNIHTKFDTSMISRRKVIETFSLLSGHPSYIHINVASLVK